MTSDEKKTSDYKDLLVWQKAVALVKRIYQISSGFPADEKFGLTAQMRRAAVSIPSNIAEGQARHTTREFIQFVSHAEGSVAELETQLIIAVQLGYCTASDVRDASDVISELRKMLNSLRRKLVQKVASGK